MKNSEIEKAKIFVVENSIEYVPHSVVSKIILNKLTGNINLVSFDAGESLAEKVLPFDIFILVIDGQTELVIDGESMTLKAGECIIVPAHSRNTIKANVRFKMISTIVKSGYEEVS